MHLTNNETFLLEMLREKDQQAMADSSARMNRFLTGVQARLAQEGVEIPLQFLALNPVTGELTDTRPAQDPVIEESAPEELAIEDIPEGELEDLAS